jgi:hypothetical protein
MNDIMSDRLAGIRIEIDADTAAMHLAAIEAELLSPSPIPPRHYRRTRLPVVVVAALLLVALSAVGALAAETAVPGDRLFPVKQATEWVRSWVDPGLSAEHRVDELEALIERRAAHEAIADQLQRAETAVSAAISDAAVDQPLVDRLDQARDRVPPAVIEPERDVTDEPPPADDAPAVDEPDETPLPDRDRDTRGDRDGESDVSEGRDGSELTALCKRVAASEHRADEFPAWVLRRCRHLLSPPRDSPDSP